MRRLPLNIIYLQLANKHNQAQRRAPRCFIRRTAARPGDW
jgi:hypothetical protein